MPIAHDTPGYRIRLARQSLGIKQNEFAEMLGISKTYLGFLERGDNGKKPTSKMLESVSNLTGKSVSWLLTGQESDIEDLAAFEDNWSDVSVKLFLGILLAEGHGIDKNTIADALRLSPHELDAMLKMPTIDFQESWKSPFVMLSKKVDMMNVYNQVHLMTRLWHKNQVDDCNRISKHAMAKVIMDAWDSQADIVQEDEASFGQSEFGVYRITRQVYQKNSPPYDRWTCLYISDAPLGSSESLSFFTDYLSQYLYQSNSDQTTFVFSSPDIYATYSSYLTTELKKAANDKLSVTVAFVNLKEQKVEQFLPILQQA